MQFRLMVAGALAAVPVSGALAQSACPVPEQLLAEPASIADLFDGLSDQSVEKGEFETSEQFQARKAAIGDPPPLVIGVDLEPREFSYDADRQVFKVFIPSLEPSSLYRKDYSVRALEDVLGDYRYGNPVQMKVRSEAAPEREYEATNGYGAATLVTEKQITSWVVFDNKGRHAFANGDNLFQERKKYETAHLEIPVPLDQAPAMKSQIRMVALIDPRQPLTAEADYRIEPTRQRPRDLRNHYKIVFADIQCVGALDGEGALLAHWKTR